MKAKIGMEELCFLTEFHLFERLGNHLSRCHGNGFVFIVCYALFLGCLWAV